MRKENIEMQELGQSLEDYLEAILILEKQLDTVHNIDIASYLGFSKSSVSHCLLYTSPSPRD